MSRRSRKFLHYITRHIGTKANGWLVRVPGTATKGFSSAKFSGILASLRVAILYRDDMLASAPPQPLYGYSRNKRNKTGIIGVFRQISHSPSCRVVDGKVYEYPRERVFWVAMWVEENTQKKKRFSVNRYGEDGARKLAKEERENQAKRLGGRYCG